MRLNQVQISISRFGRAVPKDYPADQQHISVYSDSSDSVFEALSMAYCQAVNAIREYQWVAVRTDVSTNADGGMYGNLLGRRYSDDPALDYYDKRLPMLKDLLFCLDNAEQIIGIIRHSPDRAAAAVALQEQLGLTEPQARAALRIRFELFTQEETEAIKADIQKTEDIVRRRETRLQAARESAERGKETTL